MSTDEPEQNTTSQSAEDHPQVDTAPDAARQTEGQDATDTQASRPTGLIGGWRRGRLTRRQMSFAVASALAVILLLALVVFSTHSMTTTNTVTTTIPVDATPWGVAVTPDGRHAYVTNYKSNTVSVIEVGTE